MKKTAFAAVCLMIVGPALSVAQAAQRTRPDRSRKAQVKVVSGDQHFVVGPAIYDTGVNAGFHPDVPAGSPNVNRIVGNRFNSALGQPLLMTGMLTMLTVFPAGTGYQSVSVGGTPNTMGSAAVLDFQAASVMAGVFNQITLTAPVTVPADFVAVFVGTFDGTDTAGLLGMSDMQQDGQGYHALEGFYNGGNQTMLTPVANRNAMIRAVGDILTPVELMDFKIQ